MGKYPKKLFHVMIVTVFLFLFAGQAFAAQYTVKPGDSLYLISQKFGTTVDTIMKANGLTSTTIYPGNVLNIPSATSVSGSTKYVVKSGDTLYIISRRFNTTINTLVNLNGLKSTTIYPGQVLNVPTGSTGTADTASRGAGSFSRSELMLLARLIYGESRGEPYQGQVAVGAVVLNRVKSPLFPNTISQVIYQKNEFSVVLDGQINLTPNTTSINAAEDALNGWDPSNGALFYWNPVKAPNNRFLNSKTIIARIGNHVFAK
jgi:N-acetylmuramoyl-L-alanine amidase